MLLKSRRNKLYTWAHVIKLFLDIFMFPGIGALTEMYIFTNSAVWFGHKSSPVIVSNLMTNDRATLASSSCTKDIFLYFGALQDLQCPN